MSSAYSDIEIEARGLSLVVCCRVRNRSAEVWRSREVRISSQIIDPETHCYIEDGVRVSLGEDLAPGASAGVEVPIALPPQRGSYRIYVSPMQEDAGWFYQRNWPVLAIEARVEDGRVAAWHARVATLRSLRAGLALRSLGRAFVYPFATLWRNRALIRSMVWRDILGRYRGSFGGVFWTVLNPLLLMLTYYFVFGVVLRTRFGGDPNRSTFVLYFLAGMLPWLPFSEAAGRAPTVLMEHRNFVKKVVFPLETLPVNLTAAGLVTQAFALVLFLLFLTAARGAAPLAALWLPALLVPQVMFTLGVCWFLAALGVFVRDLGQINGFLLTVWFFLTPICYPEESLPPEALGLLSKNPLFVLVRGYRTILLESSAPAPGPLWKLWLLSAAVLVLGHAWFYKLRKTFADVI
ncbi:MAG: ABC transporter permease [Bryobacterales bacterium]|nr:ABC transporter permease [Bryobacterales bacterium]